MAAHGVDAKSRFFALSWRSTDMYGFNCPSMLQVFHVAEASRRTSPLSKSRGCVVSAIVFSISHPGAISFKESINESTTYSVWPLVEAKTMCRRNRLRVKFGTRPSGLSIRYPLILTSGSPRFLSPLWRACSKLTDLKRDQTRTYGACNSIPFTSCEAPDSDVKLPHAVSKG